MKDKIINFLPLLLVFSAGLGRSLNAQVILNTNQITGTIRFVNSNPAILNLLNPPGNAGMSNLFMTAESQPPAQPMRSKIEYVPTSSPTSADYHLTVEAGNPGISYVVSPFTTAGNQSHYLFNSRTSAPVMIGTPVPPLNFEECVGVVTVQFITPGGVSLSVDGGETKAFKSGTYTETARYCPITPGATQQQIYLRSGESHRLEVKAYRGASYYSDRVESVLVTNVFVNCDQFTAVFLVVPDPGTRASMSGTVDMLREFEVPRHSSIPYFAGWHYPDYTIVIADNGPFSNQRWAAMPGTNFSVPSSGPYSLSNVVASTLDPLSPGYELHARMFLRTNRMIEDFRTPFLGRGSNPALAVTPGSSLNLSNLLVIDPGYLRGHVLLHGPLETPERPSMFRGLLHCGDDDDDHDGIPDMFDTYGVYWSSVHARGVDRRATGASLTAASGYAYADFDGNFNPATGDYQGEYELALGGLKGERSIWKQESLGLTLLNAGTNEADYFYNSYWITDTRTNDVEIVPSQPATSDIAYCFSEVDVVFRIASGTLYNPQVRFSSGGYTNANIQYSVYLDAMTGSPISSATASNVGRLKMLLPQGTYRLYPSATPGGSANDYSLTGLEPIDVTVGCRERITLEPCLQLIDLNVPESTNSQSARISGSVRSCTNVVSISYVLNGGAPQIVCNNCGINPSFSFNIPLVGECLENTFTVIATDVRGGSSSISKTIRRDATPPGIVCSTNIAISTANTNGAIVNYSVSATDNCSGPASLTCNPPSGSSFPVGMRTVLCKAADTSGNTNQCSFTVTVTATASSQNHNIDWFTIDGGGGSSSGAGYTLTGTIGQPDAGNLAGGSYTVTGGFWSVIQHDIVRRLKIKKQSGNLVLSWPADTTGVVVQSTTQLTPTANWSNFAGTPVQVGDEFELVVGPANTPPNPIRFFRLKKL